MTTPRLRTKTTTSTATSCGPARPREPRPPARPSSEERQRQLSRGDNGNVHFGPKKTKMFGSFGMFGSLSFFDVLHCFIYIFWGLLEFWKEFVVLGRNLMSPECSASKMPPHLEHL